MASRFEKFHDDVRSGAFQEYRKYWPPAARADGSNRPPTKAELRGMLLDGYGAPRRMEYYVTGETRHQLARLGLDIPQ